MLVKESIERYGTAKAISRVINELLREKLSGREDIIQLLYSKKIAKVSWEEFEEFRRKLSKRFEES